MYVEAHRRERGQCTHKEAPHNGGLYSPPPSKKHGFVEVAEIQTLFSPIFEKKVRIPPPRRMVQRGDVRTFFFPKIGENRIWISATMGG